MTEVLPPASGDEQAASKFVMEALDLGWSVRKLNNQYEIWNIHSNFYQDEGIQAPNFEGAKNVKTFTVDVPQGHVGQRQRK